MFRNKLLNYRLNKLLKKERNNNQVGYGQAASFGILYSAEDLKKHESIKKLIKYLKKDGKKVEVLSYLPEDVQNFEFRFNFFTEKDVNWRGKFKNQDILRFTEQPFDYLFYVDFESLPVMRYILALSKAKCRVGHFEEENRPVCELMVAPELTTHNSLIEEMYKYTKILA